jgi:stage II sporulation protein D
MYFQTLLKRMVCGCLLIVGILPGLLAQTLRISLFNEKQLKTVVIGISGKSYRIECDDNALVYIPENDDAFYVMLSADKLVLRSKERPLGTFTKISLIPLKQGVYFTANPIIPKANSRQFDDGLEISIAYNRISLINTVDMDNYIAGVVEAETGINATIEFYKAQSVLVRTYVNGSMNKHKIEGFQLCDGVHCQAYKGRLTKNKTIQQATKATSNLVAMIHDTTYITAVFHANCGGYTESAENAWLSKKDYLVQVKDPFCLNSPAAKWTKTITLDDWKSYLKNHGCKSAPKLSYIDFNVVNTNRAQYYIVKKDSIPYKQIRSDYQLKSSFFSISASSDEVTFVGRGYGHGVGLCQEGAIQMAKVGYNFKEILQYYFKGIEVVGK